MGLASLIPSPLQATVWRLRSGKLWFFPARVSPLGSCPRYLFQSPSRFLALSAMFVIGEGIQAFLFPLHSCGHTWNRTLDSGGARP